MTHIIVKKQDFIDAIWKEDLFPGSWISPIVREGHYAIVENACKVCAVGALFKNILKESTGIFRANEIILNTICGRGYSLGSYGFKSKKKVFEDAKKKYEGKEVNELSALSFVFETLCVNRGIGKNGAKEISRHQLYRLRKDLTRFILDTFPDKIKIKIDSHQSCYYKSSYVEKRERR